MVDFLIGANTDRARSHVEEEFKIELVCVTTLLRQMMESHVQVQHQRQCSATLRAVQVMFLLIVLSNQAILGAKGCKIELISFNSDQARSFKRREGQCHQPSLEAAMVCSSQQNYLP